MGQYIRVKPPERKWGIHPIWRGIGLIWLILLPVLSFAAAWELVRNNLDSPWLQETPALVSQIYLPTIQIDIYSFNLDRLISWLPVRLYYAELLFFVCFMFLGFGMTSIVYAFLYRMFGPPKDPYEATQIIKPRRRRIG